MIIKRIFEIRQMNYGTPIDGYTINRDNSYHVMDCTTEEEAISTITKWIEVGQDCRNFSTKGMQFVIIPMLFVIDNR
jgi:hypothetical protein